MKKLNWGNVNWYTLIVSIVALINSTLIALGGYHLDTSQLTGVDQGISLAVSIFGTLYHHNLVPATADPAAAPQAPNPPPTSGAKPPFAPPVTVASAPVQPPTPVVDTPSTPSTT